MVKIKVSPKLILQTIKALFLAALIFLALTIFFKAITYSKVLDASEIATFALWDGSVSDSLSGSGTSEDPYLITSGADLAYFKNLIENDDSNSYNQAYYELEASLNLDNRAFSAIGNPLTSHLFHGFFDGNGYSLANLNLTGQIDDTTNYYVGLFSILDGASVTNLNLKNITINVDNRDDYVDVYAGSVAGLSRNNSLIQNVAIYNNVISTSGSATLGGAVGYIDGSTVLNGLFIYNNFNASDATKGEITGYTNNATITKCVIYNANNAIIGNDYATFSDIYGYTYSNNNYDIVSYSFSDGYITTTYNDGISSLASMLTSNVNEAFTWNVEDNLVRFDNETNVDLIVERAPLLMRTSSIVAHDSGISNNIVYVNDIEADYNYYMGLNYTTNTSGTLPTTANKELYTNSNLVKMQITYSGTDIDSTTSIGYVSLTEQQDTYIYYKYYPVTNNYVLVELIDNPFTDAPTDMAFNSWVTDYEDVVISIDMDYYVRYAKIPVTYTNGEPDDITITFHADWTKATVATITSTSNMWSNAIASLDDAGMKIFGGLEPVYEDISGFYLSETIARYEDYPAGAVNNYGNSLTGYCNSRRGCTYYYLNGDEPYNASATYYELSYYYGMQQHTVQITGYTTLPGLATGYPTAGYFKQTTISNGSSITGYYDSAGNALSGTCNTSGGCTYYELIQYYDASGNENVAAANVSYYYLVTRDTNIIVMTANTTTSWSSHNKPFTLTSTYNDTDYRNNVTWTVSSVYPYCYADTRIENIKISTNQYMNSTSSPSSSASATRYFYGNYKNVKLGRGITRTSTYATFSGVFGGNNSTSSQGSATSLVKYRLIVESGFYNTITLTNGPISSYYSGSVYIAAQGIYGNDYDRVNTNNDNLLVYFDANGSWGGVYYAASAAGVIFDTTVKSGSFGTSKYDYTTGMYVGGRSYGEHHAIKQIKIEGGYIYNVIGGPLTASDRASYNDTYIFMTGGEVDGIYGGAGLSATYGNRLIQITGGTVNYSVFGGSNGYEGSDGDGTINGSSYIYIGGNATIGNATYVANNNTLFNAEAGSVFGVGNGRSGYSTIGSNDNSYIIIDGNATINRNVYGGGNYGATGVSSTSNTTETKIIMNNGTVNGSIYGGGNNNGAGSTSINATISVLVSNGTVNGSVYGGANQLGTINGSTNVEVDGGIIVNSVYGGGEGGYASSSAPGTFVSKNTNVIIGNRSLTTSPTINGSVFGGSAYGTVNGTSQTTTLSSYETIVTVNQGTIDSVYGGGEGSGTYTPYDEGNITVNINDGSIVNVFGGNDAAGTPNGSITVNVNGGNIINTYGGGNQTSINTSMVNINGGTITNVFGGGNEAGATTSNLNLNGGTIDSTFGGSNQAGLLTTTNIILKGATSTNIYGGGNAIGATTTNITLNKGTATNVYGGSNQAGDVSVTNVTANTTGTLDITNLYGGNNAGGTTTTTNLNINGGTITNVYGGGNVAITSGNTTLNINNAIISSLYGGGNQALVSGTTNVTVTNATINSNLFGGGNAGDVNGDSHVIAESSTINGSIYGGGNSAAVLGNTYVTVGGTTNVTASVFGGGNSGLIGIEDDDNTNDNAITNVEILGATIALNVYGGCNTSVVYGVANVKIGAAATLLTGTTRNNITINGTVFGGGEANASGSETYDFSFISVTQGIDINIDGSNYSPYNVVLKGSIFGSGNASSSNGDSNILIKGIGSASDPNEIISIQRVTTVTIDNSYLEISGATDRTNEYTSLIYSLNRINTLKIKNGTWLLLEENANLLSSFSSLVDVSGSEVPAEVTIATDGTTTRNVDNRLYMLANSNLNVTTNQTATAYGKITGMTFFGMYNILDNGNYSYGIYNMENGDSANAGNIIIGGSYVLGLHDIDMHYTTDGYYTNYINDDYTAVQTAYIVPTPSATTFYRWLIGTQAINYSFTMTASKYSSLGTYTLSLVDFAAGNTIFNVVGFNSEGLNAGMSLVDSNSVPRIAIAATANSVFGLSMKSETTEWTTPNTTKYLSTGTGTYTGDLSYATDTGAIAPSLTFYLYHAKNISADQAIGEVVITLQALVPRNEIEYDVSLITITIDLNSQTYTDSDAYDASITYGKKYEMPSATDVNITDQSSLTTYFSLFANGTSVNSIYGINNDYYHTLISNYALPVGTKITMIDLGCSETNPKYYYFQVDTADYNRAVSELTSNSEITYNLNRFIAMDSTSAGNVYNDASANISYYHSDLEIAMEEFLFIVDFKDTTTTGTHAGNTLNFELRNNENRTIISVLGIRQPLMVYNLYPSSNVVLNATTTIDNNYLYYDTDKNIGYNVTVGYDETTNLQSIIDTTYEANSMGINVTFLDSANSEVSSTMLIGTSIKIGTTYYYPDSDGVFRIKLAGKVANLNKTLVLNVDPNLPSGSYTMQIDLFASSDGLHMTRVDNTSSLSFTLVGSSNSLQASIADTSKVIMGDTGLNVDGNNTINYTINYASVLSHPNIRIAVYVRNKTSYTDTTYTEIDLRTLSSNTFSYPSVFGWNQNSTYEYILSANPSATITGAYVLKTNLTSGTYKFSFRLYDGDQLIDYDEEYVIIRKSLSE